MISYTSQILYFQKKFTHRHCPFLTQTLTIATETRRLVWSSIHSMHRRPNIDDPCNMYIFTHRILLFCRNICNIDGDIAENVTEIYMTLSMSKNKKYHSFLNYITHYYNKKVHKYHVSHRSMVIVCRNHNIKIL